MHPFKKLNIPNNPLILAPLAGVSDSPFRRTCSALGADLTYVEMISATALLYNSKKTYQMMRHHDSETPLGIQLTGKSADECARATEVLHKMSYATIDLNMGCPVKKVVNQGCGSGFLRDLDRLYETVVKVREATDKPLSVKTRLGWDRNSINIFEVVDAIQKAGADWLTLHGRCREDRYSTPVDLNLIHQVAQYATIPVIGNGDIFSSVDATRMLHTSQLAGVMVGRGALGNPWIFREIKQPGTPTQLDEWLKTVLTHLQWQEEEYDTHPKGAVCMRKQILWYTKGWPREEAFCEQVKQLTSFSSIREAVLSFAKGLAEQGVSSRDLPNNSHAWEPKWD